MEINRRKSLKKSVCVILIAFFCIQGVFARTEEKHVEPNGFIWHEYIELIYPEYGRRNGYYSYTYDNNGKSLFGKTRAVTFHCIDAKDEGQFTVRRLKEDVEDLYSRNGELIFKPTAKNFRFSKRFRNGDKYYYEVYQWSRERSTRYGVIDDKGNQLVPIDYRSIENSYMDRIGLENCLLVEKEIGTGRGLIKLDGSVILKPEYKVTDSGPFLKFIRSDNLDSYTLTTPEGDVLVRDAKEIFSQSWASRLKITMPNHTIGYLDYNGNWIVSPDLGYTYIDESSIGADKSYCKVGKNGMRGILDSTQKEILPCEFEDIEYIGGDFFKFKSGDFWGVINVNGKIIIPTSRGYNSIGKYSTIQKTIPFTKAESRGECNSRGSVLSLHKAKRATQEIVPQKYSTNSSQSIGNRNRNNSLNCPFIEGKKYAIIIMQTDQEIHLKGDNYLIKKGNKIIMTFQDNYPREYIIESPFKKEPLIGLTSCEVSGGPWKGKGKLAVQQMGKSYFVFFGGGMNDPTEFTVSTKPVD